MEGIKNNIQTQDEELIAIQQIFDEERKENLQLCKPHYKDKLMKGVNIKRQ